MLSSLDLLNNFKNFEFEVENLEDDLKILHQGLYYVDYFPGIEGTYVFHMVAFNDGNISHGSSATHVLTQDISGISDQILELNQVLDQTEKELQLFYKYHCNFPFYTKHT